jgi:hypothetical protein
LVSQHLLLSLKADGMVSERHLVFVGRNRSSWEVLWAACFLPWLDLSKGPVGREAIYASKQACRKQLVEEIRRLSSGLRSGRFSFPAAIFQGGLHFLWHISMSTNTWEYQNYHKD